LVQRPALSLFAIACLAGLLASACSEAARYRVLSFFFDGVPKPGVASAIGEAGERRDASGEPGAVSGLDRLPPPVQYAHPPYRENRCSACHDAQTGNLIRTSEEGLCRSCHSAVPGEVRFVHGPVAVNACDFCHEPHSSSFAGLLVTDPRSLCLRCHDLADLSTGTHHEPTEIRACTQCHSGHGGEDRFFLKRVVP